MKSVILDETLDLSSRLRPLLMGRGWKVQCVCSLQELELTASLHEPPELLIVNLTGEVTAWQISRYLQSRPVARAGLVLVDRHPGPGLEMLNAHSGFEFVERDDSARVDAWLERVLGAWSIDPETPVMPRQADRPFFCGPEVWGPGRWDPVSPAG